MNAIILSTKLYIPPLRPSAVLRTRLIAQLNEGLQRKLTLIAAPAGFGKTTLLSTWLASCERPVAWLSLDADDSDPTRFLTYLVAALQTIAPTVGSGVAAVLQSAQPPAAEAILTLLLNDLATISEPFILALDDYHVLDAKPIDDALTFLLNHMPPQVHIVIATREDPAIPLARLRARSQLTELRAADLRFTPAEAAQFLNQVMGLSLSAADIDILEDRTEGWIAGLQLAALSMQGQPDVSGFIRGFTGDHRYIVDYLVEEVLRRQPMPARSFLLQTALLDRLNGPLCDAVTGQDGGSVRLDSLERGNFFVVALDDTRQWYRYQHLFAEVLRAHLRVEQPDLIPTLHQRASIWFAANGLPADAIRHALAAKDFARAADLIELAVPAMSQSRQEATVLIWLTVLPEELVRSRPILSVYYAGALLLNGELKGVEARLRDAEQALDTQAGADTEKRRESSSTERIDAHAADFPALHGLIAAYRAASALALGRVANTMHYARRALELAPADDHLLRGSAAGLLGLAYWTNGDLAAAYQSYVECMAQLQYSGHIADTLGCAIALADIRIVQGRLRDAMHTYSQALQVATTPGAPILRGTADMHVGISAILYERNELAASMKHLQVSKSLGAHTGLPQNQYRWCVAMARIRRGEGDLADALALLDEAERLYVGDYFPNVYPLAALKTRISLAQGQVDEALDWVRAIGLSAQDDLIYLREFEHITLARVLLSCSQRDLEEHSMVEATGLLERLLYAAEEGERVGSVIEILILQARAHQLQGNMQAALVPLERALNLAEREGYVRMFVDEGPPMAILLAHSIKHKARNDSSRAYSERLIAAFPERQSVTVQTLVHDTAIERPNVLVDPLSQRELSVLRLLRTELSGPEIAEELMIGLSTVRTYTKSIYSKLDVNNRRAAINRAIELGLI